MISYLQSGIFIVAYPIGKSHLYGIDNQGIDKQEQVSCRKKLKRSQVLKFFANHPPCLIGMEACGGAHYWARELAKLGHTVRLMSPQHVKPYIKGNKK